MLLLVDRDEDVAMTLEAMPRIEVQRAAGALGRAAARRLSPAIIVAGRLDDLMELHLAAPGAILILMTDRVQLAERIAAFACGAQAHLVRSELDVLAATVLAALETIAERVVSVLVPVPAHARGALH